MAGELEDVMYSKEQQGVKQVYFDFLKDFREYLEEYIRESVIELEAAAVVVKGQLHLFSGSRRGKLKLKNQGTAPCYIGTTKMSGYRLDPGEVVELYLNNSVHLTTLSGTSTVVGFIKY